MAMEVSVRISLPGFQPSLGFTVILKAATSFESWNKGEGKHGPESNGIKINKKGIVALYQ